MSNDIEQIKGALRTLLTREPTPSERHGYFPVDEIPAYALICRATAERDPEVRKESLDEMARRGLWLSPEQKAMVARLDELTGVA